MGPTCEVVLESDDGSALAMIDALLASAANEIERTRKGRVWQLWIDGRTIEAAVIGQPPTLSLSAGCNSPQDWQILRDLSQRVADSLGGLASEPEK